MEAPPEATAPRVAAAAPLSKGPAPRQDRWQITGPGGGGAQYVPTVSPHGPNLVFVACDMGGGYVSEGGGSSWREFNLRGRIQRYVFERQNPNVIYARTDVLWRSKDRGRTWNQVYPEPKNVKGFGHSVDDEAGMSLAVQP